MPKNLSKNLPIIAIFLGIAIFGWYLFNQNQEEKKGEQKAKTEPKLLELRPTAFASEEKVFDDGTIEATFLAYPKYYEDEKGEFKEVNTTIQRTDTDYDYEVKQGVWQMDIKDDTTVGAEHMGTRLETKLIGLAYFEKETKKHAFIEKAKDIKPIVAENQMIWPNIVDGVDLKVTYIHDQLKEDFIMSKERRNSLPTPESLGIPSDKAYLGFLFDVEREGFDKYDTYIYEEGKRVRIERFPGTPFETEGPVEFEDENGEVFQEISAGFVGLAEQDENQNTREIKTLPLLKKFYKIQNTGTSERSFFSGTAYNRLGELEEGDILFDPTMTYYRGDGNSYGNIYDTTVEFDLPDIEQYDDYNSGASPAFSAYTDYGDYWGFALIRFADVFGSGDGQIGADKEVVSAALKFYVYSNACTSNPMYTVDELWTEGNQTNAIINAAGRYGATGDKAQDKHNATPVYINDAAGISSTDTSVTVDNGSGGGITTTDWPSEGLIQIGSEKIWYGSMTSTSFDDLVRGVSGTTAAVHNNNDLVAGDISWSDPYNSTGISSYLPVGTAEVNIFSYITGWRSDKTTNGGLMFECAGSATRALGIRSSEYTTVSQRPRLVINYISESDPEAVVTNFYASDDVPLTVTPTESVGTGQDQFTVQPQIASIDGDYWTTQTSTTNNGYDSQVFKTKIPPNNTLPAEVVWKGHGDAAPTYNDVSINVWDFDNDEWDVVDQTTGDSAQFRDIITNETSEISSFWSTKDILTMLPVNGDIYLGGESGKFAVYDPGTDTATDLTSSLGFGATVYIRDMAYDSVNNDIYVFADGNFKKYDLDTSSASTPTLTSSLPASARTIEINEDDGKVYLGGGTNFFEEYDIATDTSQSIYGSISSHWGGGFVTSLKYVPSENALFVGGSSANDDFARYDIGTGKSTDLGAKIPAASTNLYFQAYDEDENRIFFSTITTGDALWVYDIDLDQSTDLTSYLTATCDDVTTTSQSANAYDSADNSMYMFGNSSCGKRIYLDTDSKYSLKDDIADILGTTTTFTSAVYEPSSGDVYVGDGTGKFLRIQTAQDIELSGTLAAGADEYYDSNGYSWFWVKAENEYTPPTFSAISSGTPTDVAATITWSTNEDTSWDAVAVDTTSRTSWDAYVSKLYDDQDGWGTSGKSIIVTGRICNTVYYYRVRSCDKYGTCSYSSQGTFTTAACGGSCPFLYTHDGDEYVFQTDVVSSGKLGIPKGKDGRRKPMPHDYYVLSEGSLKAENGKYKMKLTEERAEMNYLDEARLFYIDHDPDVDIYTDQIRIGQTRTTDEAVYYTVDSNNLRTPEKCTDYDGSDCLEKVSEIDGEYTQEGRLYEWDEIEFDLGDLSNAENIKVLARAYQVVEGTLPDLPKYNKEKHGLRPPISFELEVINQEGQWEKVDVSGISFSPTEFPRTFVSDLSDVFLSDDYRIKLRYYQGVRFDYLAIDTSENKPFEISEAKLSSAELKNRLAVSEKNYDIGPYYPQYQNESDVSSHGRMFGGNFTSYGKVDDLLKREDDKFVIFQRPDELELEYEEAPKLEDGKERTFVFYSNGYYKVDKYGIEPQVEPMPFAAMSNYPYPEEEWPYDDDPDYQAYLAEYNTRAVEIGERMDIHEPEKEISMKEKIEQKMEDFGDKVKEFGKDVWSKFSGQEVEIEYPEGQTHGPLPGDLPSIHNSANTDYFEVILDKETRLKGGVELKGGVRLK